MKKLFGMALLALPLLTASAWAGFPFNVQLDASFHIKGARGPLNPQAGPWYLYWPMEAHFVAPAPTGYPYWPAPQGLPGMTFGGPACPPPSLVARPAIVPVPPVTTMPVPATPTSQPTAPTMAPANPQLTLPPYLRPTSYSYPASYTTQPPSYWYDR